MVTALHRNMDVLKKQKATVVESMKGLYQTIHGITAAVAQASEVLSATGDSEVAKELLRSACPLEESGKENQNVWVPAILELREKLELLVDAGRSR